MGIRIVIDSTSDLTEEIIQKHNLKMMPLTVNFEDGSFLDKVELSTDEFFDKLSKAKKMPTTSQVSPGAFVEAFKEILDSGDEVLGVFLGAGFSGTLESARIAKDIVGSDKIHLIDSRSVCLGGFVLVLEAIRLVEQGYDINSVVEKLEVAKDKIEIAISIDTLKYLEKGGRLSKGAAMVGSVLNIKPILTIKDSKIFPIDKVRGKNKSIKWIDKWIEENKFDLSDKTVVFFHSQNEEQLKALRNAIESKYKMKNAIQAEVGAVVGTHAGPNAIAMAFLNN